MTYFFDPSQVKRKELAPGATARSMWGDKVMMSFIELAPKAKVPLHTHPHEQAGVILQGELDFTIGTETKRVKQGDAYVIPGGVEHGVTVPEGWALVLDIFSPPREEYK